MSDFTISSFKQQNSLENRRSDVLKKLEKYPEYIPIIIEIYPKAQKIEGLLLEKNKFS